jgi:hypothetical protein
VVTVPGVGQQLAPAFDPGKLPGIHRATVQPGPKGEEVAVAIREESSEDAYAYWAEKIYSQQGQPFPGNSDAALPPGSYTVRAEAIAGEIPSAVGHYELEVPQSGPLVLRQQSEGA